MMSSSLYGALSLRGLWGTSEGYIKALLGEEMVGSLKPVACEVDKKEGMIKDMVPI